MINIINIMLDIYYQLLIIKENYEKNLILASLFLLVLPSLEAQDMQTGIKAYLRNIDYSVSVEQQAYLKEGNSAY